MVLEDDEEAMAQVQHSLSNRTQSEPQSDIVESPEYARQKSRQVAFALFLGLLIDGVPEGILFGFFAAEGHLTPVLVISLFVANFPEAFSSSSLLVLGKMSIYVIVGMWTMLCVLVGCLAGLSCKLLLSAYPDFAKGVALPIHVLIFISIIEGVTGGAMLACISSVMLLEAFERAGKDGHLVMTSGFLSSCGLFSSRRRWDNFIGKSEGRAGCRSQWKESVE